MHTSLAAVVVVASLQIFGELRPIRLTREQSAAEELSISTAFGLVLMLVSSIGIAIGAQVIAVLLDGMLRRRPISAMVLSVARYTVAFGGAQVVYAALRGEALLDNNSAFTSQDVLPALAAAATLLVLNMALISAAVAFRSGDSVREHLRENLHFMISGSVLATLAPVVAAVMNFNVWLVPLLLLPILAVQRTAGLFLERERRAMHDALTGLPNRAQLQSRVEAICANPRTQHQGRGHDRRPRPLQGDQRHPRPPRRRRADQGGRRAAGHARPRGRHRGPARRRRVRARRERRGRERRRRAGPPDRQGAADPFLVSGVSLDVQASIGIALAPLHGEDSETLLRRADVALYTAKESRGCFAIYSPDEDLHTPQRLALLGDLRRGIDNDELHLHYQPQCDVRTGQVVGVEALVTLAAPGARAADAGAVHLHRREHRPDRAADDAGARDGGHPAGPLASGRLRPADGGQPVRTPPHQPRAAGPGGRDPAPPRCPADRADPRGHREHDHGRPVAGHRGPRPAARVRRPAGRSTTSVRATRRCPTCAASTSTS